MHPAVMKSVCMCPSDNHDIQTDGHLAPMSDVMQSGGVSVANFTLGDHSDEPEVKCPTHSGLRDPLILTSAPRRRELVTDHQKPI